MKLKLLIFSYALYFASAIGQTDKIDLNNYRKIDEVSDEFNESSLNDSKWNIIETNYRPTFAFIKENVQFGLGSDGTSHVLKLVTKKQQVVRPYVVDAETWTLENRLFNYTAAHIRSKAKFTYGYYEIRSKISNSKNSVGQTFWFWGQDNIEGYREIDVFETSSSYPNTYPMAQHYGAAPCINKYDYNNQTHTPINFDLTADFHTYGLDWQPNYIAYYIDGKLFKTFTTLTRRTINYSSCAEEKEIGVEHLKSWMWCVLWSWTSGTIEPTRKGDEYEIDYFRVYENKPTITLSSYSCSEKIYTYKVKNTLPNTNYTWNYNDDYFQYVNEFNALGSSYIALQIKPEYAQTNVGISVSSTRNISGITTIEEITATSETIIVGNDNPKFTLNDPQLVNNKLVLTARASSDNRHSRWDIGIWNPDGTISYTTPQTQYGKIATFTNLSPNKKYTIKHGVYGECVKWSSSTQDIFLSYDSDFSYETPVWEKDQLNIYVSAVNDSPISQWKLYVKMADGTYNYVPGQTKYGPNTSFKNLSPGHYYKILHGKYSSVPNSYTSTSKDVWVNLNAAFEYRFVIEKDLLSLNPYTIYSNFANVWYLHSIDEAGEPSVNPIQTLYGDSVFFRNVQYDKKYMIKHGVYNQNGNWSEIKKVMRLEQECLLKADINSESEVNNQIEKLSSDIEGNINIYPNPASDIINISFSKNIKGKLSIVDLFGSIVKSEQIDENSMTINVSNLCTGIYILKIEIDSKVINKKLLIER